MEMWRVEDGELAEIDASKLGCVLRQLLQGWGKTKALEGTKGRNGI